MCFQRNAVALIVILAALLAPAAARAAPLPLASARRAVLIYERTYWTGQHQLVTLSVDGCRHEGHRASCIVKATSLNRVVNSRDYVTRLPGGVLRVHAGLSETLEVLAD